ncbi:MFS transporter [Saccharibacillus sp. O23]|uniref:MFS transporter n=1 Tax=Saccharibacillus sp. O23 TaxID=2009338 RepID=UPI000B4E2562|nr:MFS transporter [Saccharibacillus sp. O23]OWR27209.1 MFS transporter [Saccharibacillus sp. O23]
MIKSAQAPTWSPSLALLLASACGLAVANIYYAQPLLGQLAEEFGVSYAAVGSVVSVIQLFYAAGLLLIVPLGDLRSRRRMILVQLLSSSVALTAAGLADRYALLLAALAAVGSMAVVTQVLVNFASSLAPASRRGSAVGTVTGGVVIGILLARTVAGVVSELGGWRAVYLLSAALTAAVALALFRWLPEDDSAKSKISYGQTLRSLPELFAARPLLRSRAVLALLIFADFGMLWTPLAIPLGEAPLGLSPAAIGAFGLAGAAGALGAARAGRWADRGLGPRMTIVALAVLLVAWLPIGMLHRSLALLVVGILLLDFAVQVVHVSSQSLLFAAFPEARGRLTGAYMVFYSIGSALGAFLSTRIYAAFGWQGVSLTGAGIAAIALAYAVCSRDARHV